MKIEYSHIPQEKFRFVQQGKRLLDDGPATKQRGYFLDALHRFCKDKSAVTAAVIIFMIIVYAIAAPLAITTHDGSFMVSYYARKPARINALRKWGIFDGGVNRELTEAALIRLLALGMGAADADGTGVTLEEGLNSEYMPMLSIGEGEQTVGPGGKPGFVYPSRVDTYLEVGFIYRSIEQEELKKMLAWQEETGKQLLYPLIDTDSPYCADPNNANLWYKTNNRQNPIRVNANGTVSTISYAPGMVLEDNYRRNADGEIMYYAYTGGGSMETAQFKVRVLYYNYYQYLYGFEPNYLMGTESQGYDMALRIAGGIRLSLLIALSVCIINFLIGALYGAIEGYYGGAIDLVMERICDILSGVPFIIVATLFQIHLAQRAGPLVCLLFAYVLTGWIGTAYRVRTQFYRYKHQEYVLAARTVGARDRRIIFKHIFPNTLGTIITSSALAIPSTIMSESMLSYLGIVNLGSAGGTSLGTLLADAQSRWIQFPHLMLYPALVISLLMICFNLFGNGLRDAFNPALRGVDA